MQSRTLILAIAVLALACGTEDGDGSQPDGGSGAGGASGNAGTGGGVGGSGGVAGNTGGGGGIPDAGSGGSVSCTPSGPIVLNDGATSLSDLCITSSDKGIEGGNATLVTTVSLQNVTIDSVNYGVYLGDCQEAVFDHVDITTDPAGGDSYSVRGAIAQLTSSSSTYRAGIKAFRIYGLMGGSSTLDTFIGGRMMLGGGPASEWENPLPFQDFQFNGGSVDVESIEIYDATHHVTFDGVDFAGTGHISIQPGAHDLSFLVSKNLPDLRFYDTGGNQYDPDAAELAARSIVVAP